MQDVRYLCEPGHVRERPTRVPAATLENERAGESQEKNAASREPPRLSERFFRRLLPPRDADFCYHAGRFVPLHRTEQAIASGRCSDLDPAFGAWGDIGRHNV